VIDERAAFRDEVVEPFVRAYLEGTTPSPCVHCNRGVKLGRLMALADALGCEHLATGHYARITHDTRGTHLLRGADRDKDQSYFLFGLPESVRRRLIFPLGDLNKPEVRAEGRRLGVPNADKPDSQQLCFVPDGDVGGFVERNAPPGVVKAGVLREEDGRAVGTHGGVHRFTVGQRRGLGLAGGGDARYVLRILPESGDVVIGGEASLLSEGLRAREAVWSGAPPSGEVDAAVRVRYRHQPAAARVRATPDGFEARFLEPQRAVAPGQAAVVYVGEEVVAGGFIC
jgi:tRNA-specific 2-thiouridylase